MSGRNCERYVPAAIDSLMWQTHPAVHVLFVDDASTDATADLAQAALDAHFPGRHTMVRNLESWGKARNAHVHLRAVLSKGDFVAIVDADDQLARADALALLATEYESGHDVVWTRYETDAGAVGKTGPLDPFNAPRIQGWKTSHLFSFRAPLFESVPESYLRDDQGEWFRAACDFAIAYPVLDQTRRYKHLPLVAYRYTASNPASHHNSDPQAQGLNSTRQMAAARQVLAKPPLPCRRWVFGEHPAADEAFASMLTRLQSQPAELAVVAAPDTARSPADPWLQAAAAVAGAGDGRAGRESGPVHRLALVALVAGGHAAASRAGTGCRRTGGPAAGYGPRPGRPHAQRDRRARAGGGALCSSSAGGRRCRGGAS
jgi:hypothetical protein